MAAYSTYIEADTYFQDRLYTLIWDEATSVNKTIALTEATQRIDRLRFKGKPVDDNQELEFPRYYGDAVEGDEIIPNNIKIACYEIAYALLDDIDPDQELENLSVSSQGYSNVRASYVRSDVLDHIAAGIPSASAWRYLLPYLATGKTIRIYRVS